MEYCALSLDEVKGVAQKILADFSDHRVFAFYGQMGAGKTTLIKSMCEALCVTDSTSSPTYSIVNEYHTREGNKIYHFDFYRIKNLEEAIDIGCEEYFYSKNYCFIEWPQVVESILPSGTLKFSVIREYTVLRVLVI